MHTSHLQRLLAWPRISLLCGLLLFGWSGAVWAGPDGDAATEQSYQAARNCYYGVQSDPKKVRDRGAWERCAQAFLTLAKTAPTSGRGADAAYTAGRLYEQLFSLSNNTEDLRTAQEHYLRFAKKYRKHRLTDDALLRMGIIAWEGFHQRKAAERWWWQVIHWTKDGDQVKRAQALLAQLGTLQKKEFRSLAPLLSLNTPQDAGSSGGSGLQASRGPSAAHATLAVPRASAAPPAANTTRGAPAAADAPAAVSPKSLHIVIDPGHGGKDPGAQGPHGTQEKAVTLVLAQKLAEALRTKFGCTTTLTRSNDRYVSLGERNRIANKRRADLFISLHANAAPNADAHGMQTYFLNNASDEAARRLAARENAAVAGATSDAAGTELERIMSTMLQNAYTEESRDLADLVQRTSVKALKGKYARVNDQGVHSALFYVLVGAKSPAVLVETAFISNPEEELRLRDAQYQTTLVNAIVSAVEQYFKANPKRATL